MKNIFSAIAITAALSAPGIVSAQSHHRHTTFAETMKSAHGRAHAFNARKYAAKTTATDVRLKSIIDFENDGSTFVITDSVDLTYVGLRNGSLDDHWMEWGWKFTDGLIYQYNGTTYDPAELRVSQTFDASDNIDTSKFDQWNSTTMAWEPSMRTIYTHDAAGNVLSELNESWTGSAWEGYYRVTYTYTPSNKVATSLEENWNTTTMAWENSNKVVLTWDASDKLTSDTTQYWDMGTSAWTDGNRNTYIYDGSGNKTEELYEAWSGTSWDVSSKTTHRNFAMFHQPMTSVYMYWNSSTSTLDSNSRQNYTYNTYGKPVYQFSEQWNDIANMWESNSSSYATRYNYEEYSTTGVKDAADFGGNATLYPVPANGQITINTTWAEAQPFTTTITDMCGRVHSSWTVAATKQYNETISVAQLPAGNYMLTLQGKQGKVTRQFNVVK